MDKNRLNEIRIQAIIGILSGRASTTRPMSRTVVNEAILCADVLMEKLERETETEPSAYCSI